MVRATLSKPNKGTKFNQNTDTGYAVKKKKLKPFSKMEFQPVFKKKTISSAIKSNRQNLRVKKVINKLLKEQRSTNGGRLRHNHADILNKTHLSTLPSLTSFRRLNLNKPLKNYINKGSHLSSLSNITKFKSKLIASHDQDTHDQESQDQAPRPKNRKKAKRAKRQTLFREHIINKAKEWQIPKNDELNIDYHQNKLTLTSKIENKNMDKKEEDKSTSLDTSSLLLSLEDTEKDINKERKKVIKSQTKIAADSNSLTALFKDTTFDANPLEYTKQALQQQSDLLDMECEIFKINKNNSFKPVKKKNGFKNGKHSRFKKKNGYKNGIGHKMHLKKNGVCDDHEINKQITKQLLKHNKADKTLTTFNNNKSSGSSQKKFTKALKFKINKIGKNKNGKFIAKKMKRKMTKFQKENQKKRRWRV